MKAAGEFILHPGEIRLLERLRLNPRKVTGGRIRGDRLTRKKGVSIEFADYRDYTDGDDVRHLDWNVLARMQTPVIRTYQDEEDVAVYVLLDCSTSMDFGDPSKFAAAKRIAAAIGYIALCGSDALHSQAMGRKQAVTRALRGRTSFLKFDSWLSDQHAECDTALTEVLRNFTAGKSRPGLAIVMSDGLDPGICEAVARLGSRGHEVAFIQILAPEEIDPDIEGDLRLLDSESQSAVEITANSQAIREYKNSLQKHCEALASACRRVGGRYVQVTTRDSIQSLVKDKLRRGGWVT
ncbi:MAG: DUF58 domain-containing protein [Fimbriimonadales bacterium]